MVIAIIAILAALLLPALSRAKEKGRQIVCVSNLRQLQLGWQMYVNDNGDVMPLNTQSGSGPTVARSLTNCWIIGNAQVDTDPAYIRNGTLYQYAANTAVYHCPTDLSTIAGTSQPRNWSYALQSFLNGMDPTTPTGTLKKYSQLPSPGKIFAFLDEDFHTIDDGMFWLRRSPDDEWTNLASDRHNQGANFSFADGHCEHFHWKAPKHYVNYSQVATGGDLDDLRKIQDLLAPAP